MKLLSFLCSAYLAIISASAHASEPKSVRDRVADFLQTKVMGHSQQLISKGELTVDGKTYLVSFQATISWSGLEKTKEGLVFDETREIKQTNTEIDANGTPIGEAVKTDRSVTHHYALGERLVTKSLVGITTMTKNSIDDPTGQGSITMVEISNDGRELYIYESLAGFSESSLDGKNLYPVATASSATLFVNKDGKLQTDETLKFYKVDVNKDFAREEINRFNLSAIELTR